MPTESFIQKLQADPDGLDFSSLRERAIELVQEWAGDVWTDYNLHDPGVTILESWCYVLTDLLYRSSFPAADYLAGEDGKIDYAKQGLYPPNEILPCQAVTEHDYRKLMLSAIPNIDNLWVSRVNNAQGEPLGLYHFFVQLNNRVAHQEKEGVRQAYVGMIEKIYATNRNLCEDLDGITFVERVPFALRGKIEIDGKRDAVDVLADVYFACAQYLSPQVPIQAYADAHRAGKSIEQLFDGVLTERGYIDDENLYPWRDYFSIADLLTQINQIKGVKRIDALIFVDVAGNALDHIALKRAHQEVAALKLPEQDDEIEIRLVRAGKSYEVHARDVLLEFNRLNYQHQALRQQQQRFDWIATLLPTGQYRELGEYYPLQNHLPDIYGMNAYGLPDSEPNTRKAQAAQLKAYLLFFEQIMANFVHGLGQIKHLYSLADGVQATYFYQQLRNDTLANVESLYLNGGHNMADELARLMASFDAHGERRNRVLDYLLALYGEKFNQHSLRHYFPEGANVDQFKINKKLYLLNHLPEWNKNRAAAAGLKQKLMVLLGIQDFHLIEHILLRPDNFADCDDFYPHRISLVFQDNQLDEQFSKLVEETVCLNCPAHIYPEIFWLDAEQFSALDLRDTAAVKAILLALRGEHV